MLYTRREHGSLPVTQRVDGSGQTWYRVHAPGGLEEYPSVRQLLMALHGGRDSGLSWDRYFRLGRYGTDPRPRVDLAGLFRRARSRSVRGIDLDQRGVEVAKLLNSSLGSAIRGYGYDFNDVLQEVYAGILVRNEGRSAWDPRRASFGYYVTMVCLSVFRNYHKREARRRGRERVGLYTMQDSEWSTTDAGEKAAVDPWGDLGSYLLEVEESIEDLSEFILERQDAYRNDSALYQDAEIARAILPLVYQGHRRRDIAETLDLSGPAVGRALSYLRKVAHEWTLRRGLH